MAHALTANIAMELISHEAIVTEAYRDSGGIWTWGIGITNRSGHIVHPRYLDRPQTLRHCLDVFADVVRTTYLPVVARVFADYPLTEAQVGAALSFQYNTGGLPQASWAKCVLAGDLAGAYENLMAWNKSGGRVSHALSLRRARERDLFFDGIWSNDGTALVIPVAKPAYTPDLERSRRIPVRHLLKHLSKD